jgi:hypothetical protein
VVSLSANPFDGPAEIVPDPEREEILAFGREMEIAALEHSSQLAVLREALADAEAEMARVVGRNVMTSNREVNQRQLDYTRGYYDGARFWLAGRIALAKQRVALQEAKAAGTDPRPTGNIDPRTGDPRSEGVDA